MGSWVFSAKPERLFLPAFHQVPPSVSATKPAPDVILMNHSIPEGVTLTVSPRWRQSLGKVPGALSLSAAPARPGCALPAPAQEARRGEGGKRSADCGPCSWGAPFPLRPGRPSHARGLRCWRAKTAVLYRVLRWAGGSSGRWKWRGWGWRGKLSAETPSPTPEAPARRPRV